VIAWYDNVPLLSYVLLGGRCRACRTPIGRLYPAVELATSVLLAACLVAFGFSLEALAAAVFCAALVVVTATDLTHRIVPNLVVLPAAAIVCVLMTAADPSPEWAIAGIGAAAFLLAVALAYPGGMGMGDVKLALLMGVALGRTVAVALPLGMVLALVPAVVLFARHGSGARKMAIPFAPFLALGSVIALFAGDALVHAYTSLF
jgi:leader peptidase (prepilin peptidase)/N-methyltransferase